MRLLLVSTAMLLLSGSASLAQVDVRIGGGGYQHPVYQDNHRDWRRHDNGRHLGWDRGRGNPHRSHGTKIIIR